MSDEEDCKMDITDELRTTAGNLINGVIGDGEVSTHMLVDAADEIDRLRPFADVALKNAIECSQLELKNIGLSSLVERMTRAVKASMIYYGSYVQDEAEEVECCISPEQHEAAVEMRESLLIAMAALTGTGRQP
jgi:hypothetical protein